MSEFSAEVQTVSSSSSFFYRALFGIWVLLLFSTMVCSRLNGDVCMSGCEGVKECAV